MTVIPDPAFVEAMANKSRKPIWLVRISTGLTASEGVDQFSFISGDKDMFGFPRDVSRVSPVAPAIDELTRRFAGGDWKVLMTDQPGGLDSGLRKLFVTQRLKNQLVVFKRGEQSLTAVSQFLDVGRGIIKTANGNGRQLTLVAYDVAGILRRKQISGADAFWVNLHPLEVIEDILIKSDVPAALYDATTLDPNSAQYTSGANAISHFNTARQNKTPQWIDQRVRIKESVDAMTLVNELCELMGGSFVPDRAGIYRFILFTGITGNSRTLGTDDYKGDLQNDILGTLKNRWTIFSHFTEEGYSMTHVASDTDSIDDHKVPGGISGIDDGKVESKWINGYGWFTNPGLSPTAVEGDTFNVTDAGISGFSGCRYNADSFTRPTFAEPSDPDRLIYMLIRGRNQSAFAEEVISVKDIIIAPGAAGAAIATDEFGREYRRTLEFTIKARGLFGTTPQDFRGGFIQKVFDLTPQLRAARFRVERFAYGPPRVRVPIDAAHIDLELLDQLKLPDRRLIDFGKDGEDITGTYELVRLEDHHSSIVIDLAKIPSSVVGTVEEDPPDFLDPTTPTDPLIERSTGSILIERSTGLQLFQRSP